MTGYRAGLRTTAAAAAVPYGYTATVWTAGGVLIHTHGAPGAPAAALFLVGVVGAFGATAALAAPARTALEEAFDPLRAGAVSAVAAFAGLGCSALAAPAVPGDLAYLVVGLLATVVYFAIGAAGLALIAPAHDHEEPVT